MFQFYLVTLLLPIVPLTYNSSELTKERKSVTRLLLFSVNEHTEIRDIKKLTSKRSGISENILVPNFVTQKVLMACCRP